MIRMNIIKKSEIRSIPILEPRYQFWKRVALSIVLLIWISGCHGPTPLFLQTHFKSEPHGSKVIQGKLSAHSQNQLPVGMAIVLNADPSHVPLAITEATFPQFVASVNHKIQRLMPMSMQEVIQLDEIPSGERISLLKGMEENRQIEAVLVVLPTSREVKVPARFNVLPEVGTLNGYQIENHATVELGLLDLKSGKLLLQSQGNSYATLEQLAMPLASNQYPRVRGSAMTSPIYPEEDQALESLRMVAMNEALDQAVMKLSGKWHDGHGNPPSQVGKES